MFEFIWLATFVVVFAIVLIGGFFIWQNQDEEKLMSEEQASAGFSLMKGHPVEEKDEDDFLNHFITDQDFVGIDLETSGLDPRRDTIIEIAVVVFDRYVNVKFQLCNVVIGHTREQIEQWTEWAQKVHDENGLLKEALESNVTLEQAINVVDERLRMVMGKDVRPPLMGSNVSFDRDFLRYHAPQLLLHFSYRNIDVSTIYELAKVWFPSQIVNNKSQMNHRALGDILQTGEYLRHYLHNVFQIVESPRPERHGIEPVPTDGVSYEA